MALLNRLFSSRKKEKPQGGYVPLVPTEAKKQFEFTGDQVRVLLFRECERRGRKLLFDSKAVKKVPLSIPSQSKLRFGSSPKTEELKKPECPYVEICKGYGYQYTRPGPDTKPLGEMIFGSVAMAFRSSTFKVHVGGNPPVMMFSKVALSPGRRVSDRSLEDSYGSSISSMSDYFNGGGGSGSSSDSKLCRSSGTYPLDVPLPSSLTMGASQFLRRGSTCNTVGSSSLKQLDSVEADSGCCVSSDSSVGALLPSSSNPAFASLDSRKSSGGSLCSLRRRWLRTASSSIDFGSSLSLTKTDSLASCGSLSGCADDKPARRTKLGVALLINLNSEQKEAMEQYVLEHGALFESMLVRLHASVERAYCRKECFVSLMVDASCDVQRSIEDLFLGPRLPAPVWLGLLSAGSQSPTQRSALASGFIQDLCEMLESYDTKDTNFFVSTVVTAVLTHHLGWVPTVNPDPELLGNKLGTAPVPTVHPYNPLWAQAMDLFGALGHPLKTSRTIIISVASSKARLEIIEKLLRVLSYFIRCAGIERREPKIEESNVSSCLNNCKTDAHNSSNTLSADDRAASSTTLRPVSGECTPLLSMNHVNTPGNASEISDSSQTNPLLIMDFASSKSENSLNIINETNALTFDKKMLSKGLRRTMSYSSKISSAAKLETSSRSIYPKLPLFDTSEVSQDLLCPETLPEKVSRLCRVPTNALLCQVKPPLPQKEECERQRSALPSSHASEAVNRDQPSSDKVIFVLGENENLVGLKSNKKIADEDHDLNSGICPKKSQEQPTSFSGSEVESGFSECESFELSPSRSVSGNVLTSQSRGEVSEDRTWDSAFESEEGGLRMCLSDLTNKLQASPFMCNTSPRVVTVHSTVIQVESGGTQTISQNSSNHFRSLARSLSVNLPVCSKLNMPDTPNITCMKCNINITVSEQRENVSPTRDLKEGFCKKNGKKLRRSHSFFCVQNNVTPCLRKAMCQKCCYLQSSLKPEASVLTNQQSGFQKKVKANVEHCHVEPEAKKPNIVELPLPRQHELQQQLPESSHRACEWGIAGSLFGGLSPRYMAEKVLQGCAPLTPGWELNLKRDLALDAQRPTLDPSLVEAVAIVANVDSWEVQLMSSHTYVVDRPGTLGVRVGLSQLVANMLESLFHMWKLRATSEMCLSYIENRLRELWLRSHALSELLLTSELCDMDLLTTSLSLEPNDVPLLLAVASTHSPEVTQKYGLSFR